MVHPKTPRTSYSSPRYAIYFSPAESSSHWAMGTRWLGRNVITGARAVQPHVPELSAQRVVDLTAAARHYGLHATLKPPFLMRNDRSVADLDSAIRSLANGFQSFSFDITAGMLSEFIAWLPVNAVAQLNAIAATCVERLDAFRAEPDMAEIARRRGLGLSERQDALLQRWGYPYVMDEFRFHMTLTDRSSPQEQSILLPYLQDATSRLVPQGLQFDALCLFVEPAPKADFLLAARYSFDGQVQYLPAWHQVA